MLQKYKNLVFITINKKLINNNEKTSKSYKIPDLLPQIYIKNNNSLLILRLFFELSNNMPTLLPTNLTDDSSC